MSLQWGPLRLPQSWTGISVDDDQITPGDALEQSRLNRQKTEALAAQVDSSTQVVRSLRVENHWAQKIKDNWAGSAI